MQIEVIAENPNLLFRAFKAESAHTQKDRASYSIRKGKSSVTFDIGAKDATALRATSDSIIKLLIVHEKMQKL